MRYLLLVLSGMITAFTIAQPDVLVYGLVKDIRTGERPTGISVEAIDLKWGRWKLAATSDSSKYELDLGRNGEWLVTFSVPGYVSKRIKLMLFGPTPEEWVGGFGMNVDMTMIQPQEGVDYSLLEEPFGICRYNSETGMFEWDLAYTEKMRERQAAMLEAR
ncbi:MAG: hypothetical protein IPM12_11135 [Flavobacteriales bacterium]|nr:hypothetical protein [Flavobacteriales bacterium]